MQTHDLFKFIERHELNAGLLKASHSLIINKTRLAWRTHEYIMQKVQRLHKLVKFGINYIMFFNGISEKWDSPPPKGFSALLQHFSKRGILQHENTFWKTFLKIPI